MSEELKPCPWCNGEAYAFPVLDRNGEHDGFSVLCFGCDASIETYASKEKAIFAWNTRPVEDALRAERDAALAEAARLREAIPWAEIYFAWDALGEKRQRMTRGFGPTEARNHAPELAQFIEDNDELVGAAIHAWERAHAPQQQEAQEAQNE